MRKALVLALICASTRAIAEEAPDAAWGWHAGLNVRTDLGTHPVRVDGGVRKGALDLVAVLDPMSWTDGQLDLDLMAQWRLSPAGYAAFAGWRSTGIGIAGGTQWQQKLLVGAAGALPSFFDGALQAQWGLELATLVVKHGGGLESEVLRLKSSRYWIDLLQFGMFARFSFDSLGGK